MRIFDWSRTGLDRSKNQKPHFWTFQRKMKFRFFFIPITQSLRVITQSFRLLRVITGVLIIRTPLKRRIIKAEGNFGQIFENNKSKKIFEKIKIIKARRRRKFFGGILRQKREFCSKNRPPGSSRK